MRVESLLFLLPHLLLLLPSLLALLLSVEVVGVEVGGRLDNFGRGRRVRAGERFGSGWLRALWIVASALLIAVPSWVLTDLSPLLRCLGLGAAMGPGRRTG